MNESNHKMVNMLPHQIETLFNHLNHNTNHSYQQLAHKIDRITYFFGDPQAPI